MSQRLALPIRHADALFHGPGWVARPRDAFVADLAAIAAQPRWVIDGNYFHARYGPAMDERLARADRIILLDLPRRVTKPRILRRVARYRGQVRPDSAPGCPERLDLAFLIYCWRWRRAVRPGLVQLLEAAGERVIRYGRTPTLERVLSDLG